MALTAAQQEIRRKGISGSRVAAVCGLSPYQSPIDVWRELVGEAPEREETAHMIRGQFLGPAIAEMYEATTGKLVTHRGDREQTLVSARHPLVIATPDGLVHSAGRGSKVVAVLECKAPSWRTAYQWGEGGDDVPDHHVPQLIWECAAAGVDRAEVAALLGDELRIYSVAWDEDLFQVLLELSEKFWRDHVETRIPPRADGTASYTEYLKERFPRGNSTMLQADANTRAVLEMYRAAREELDHAEKRADELKQALLARIGNADGIEAEGIGRATWRICKGRESLNVESLKAEVGEETIKRHMRQGSGYRRFLATFK